VPVHWSAHDDNDDELAYSLYYRGDGEMNWKPLTREPITEKTYNLDTTSLPDGGYTIKVVASDAPSHSPGEALTAEKVSTRFEIDTTPPRIEGLSAVMEEGKLRVRFEAVDGFSAIRRAEYSVDAGEWQFVEPVSKLSDALRETYDFKVAVPTVAGLGAGGDPAEHVIAVRVYNRFDNAGSAKAVVRAR